MQRVNEIFSHLITERRKQVGISQEQLAERAGIHRTYVSQLERGIKVPTLTVLFNLSGALGIKASLIVKQLEDTLYDLHNP